MFSIAQVGFDLHSRMFGERGIYIATEQFLWVFVVVVLGGDVFVVFTEPCMNDFCHISREKNASQVYLICDEMFSCGDVCGCNKT